MLAGLCRDYKFALFKMDAVCGQLRPEKQEAFARLSISISIRGERGNRFEREEKGEKSRSRRPVIGRQTVFEEQGAG